MALPKRPFYFTPEDYFDFGFMGEHPVEFTCWIGDEIPGYKLPVRIHRVVVKLTFKNPKEQEVDFTEEFHKYAERVERYEDEVRADYLSKREKDWDEVGA